MVTEDIFDALPKEPSLLDKKLHALLNQPNKPSDLAIRDLIAKGANPNSHDATYYNYPLHMAAHHGHAQAITTLIELGAHIEIQNLFGDTALLCAAKCNQPEALKALINHGASIFVSSASYKTALHVAAQNQSADALQVLLNTPLKATINQKDHDENTPLHAACLGLGKWRLIAPEKTDLEMSRRTIQSLLDAGADPNMPDCDGQTPLMLCMEQPVPEVTRLLMSVSDDLNRLYSKGFDALYYAVKYGRAENASLLLEAGVDVNRQTATGDSLLHQLMTSTNIETQQQRIDTARLLVAWGLDLNQPDADNYTPLRYAVLMGDDTEISQALLDLGAEILHDMPDTVQTTTRRAEAQARFDATLGATPPDVSSLTATDLIWFSNIGKLDQALHASLWKDRTDQLTSLLSDLPPYLAEHIASLPLYAPTARIGGWNHEGIAMPPLTTRSQG